MNSSLRKSMCVEKLRVKRGVVIFYPFSFYIAIVIAIIYCFAFWTLRNLGKFRIPLFLYALVVQLAFLIFFFWMSNYFRTTESLNRDYYDIFLNWLGIFYFLMAIPLMVSLWYQTYKGIWKLEIGKASKTIMMVLFVIVCLILLVVGLYAHILFYYGFAP